MNQNFDPLDGVNLGELSQNELCELALKQSENLHFIGTKCYPISCLVGEELELRQLTSIYPSAETYYKASYSLLKIMMDERLSIEDIKRLIVEDGEAYFIPSQCFFAYALGEPIDFDHELYPTKEFIQKVNDFFDDPINSQKAAKMAVLLKRIPGILFTKGDQNRHEYRRRLEFTWNLDLLTASRKGYTYLVYKLFGADAKYMIYNYAQRVSPDYWQALQKLIDEEAEYPYDRENPYSIAIKLTQLSISALCQFTGEQMHKVVPDPDRDIITM
ncbi:MAG: hypothetical protein Fur003_1050 [Candidatus Dojkabacteria bacterium]